MSQRYDEDSSTLSYQVLRLEKETCIEGNVPCLSTISVKANIYSFSRILNENQSSRHSERKWFVTRPS